MSDQSPQELWIRKDLFELHLKVIAEQLDRLDKQNQEILVEVKRTNGRLQVVERDISRMKAIGATITSILSLVLGFLGLWKR